MASETVPTLAKREASLLMKHAEDVCYFRVGLMSPGGTGSPGCWAASASLGVGALVRKQFPDAPAFAALSGTCRASSPDAATLAALREAQATLQQWRDDKWRQLVNTIDRLVELYELFDKHPLSERQEKEFNEWYGKLFCAS